jgi:hypothetical protein
VDLTAVIFTFHRGALSGALLTGLAAAMITLLFARRKRNALGISLVVAVAWFFIALFAIQATLGIGAGSIEVVSYERSE